MAACYHVGNFGRIVTTDEHLCEQVWIGEIILEKCNTIIDMYSPYIFYQLTVCYTARFTSFRDRIYDGFCKLTSIGDPPFQL